MPESVVIIVMSAAFLIVIFASIFLVRRSKKSPMSVYIRAIGAANKLFQANNYSAALGYYEKAIASEYFAKTMITKDSRSNALLLLARCNVMCGFLDDAKKLLEEAEPSKSKQAYYITMGYYYQRLCFSGKSHYPELEKYFRLAAEENINILNRIVETYLVKLDFEKAESVALELFNGANADAVNACATLIKVYKLSGELEKFRALLQNAKNIPVPEREQWTRELNECDADDRRCREEKGESIKDVLTRLGALYQSDMKTAYRLSPVNNKKNFPAGNFGELTGKQINGLTVKSELCCVDLTRLDKKFRAENGLPAGDASLKVLMCSTQQGEVVPYVYIDKKTNSYLGQTACNLEKTEIGYRLNSCNSDKLAECFKGSMEDIRSYALIKHFLNFYFSRLSVIRAEKDITSLANRRGTLVMTLHYAKAVIYVVKTGDSYVAEMQPESEANPLEQAITESMAPMAKD